jgi:mono/diheme cytochrome c family protein
MIGLVWRRWRWPLLIAGIATLVLATPHLDLLVISAYPTSFFVSPTEFAASSIAHGAQLYQANCAVCHGAGGHDDGPAAQALSLPPADLTAEHLWAHSDGELFWFVSHGMEGPTGALTMPGFAGKLSSEARWHLIDYLRAHNAGESMHTSNTWPHPLPVPQFDAECANERIIDRDILNGRTLRIILGSHRDAGLPAPPDVALSTIIVTNRPLKPHPASCVSQDPDTWAAFAVLIGVSPEAVGETQILVDKNGWLRARWLPTDVTDQASLSAEIKLMDMHPLELGAGNRHAHHN